jgi:solute carrier family 25 folate transporter 32
MALHLTAAMVAGATGSCITNPLWVVKTRFMVSAFHTVFAAAVFLRTGFNQLSYPKTQPPEEVRYRNTLDAFLRIYRGEGIYAFYRGLIPSLVGVSHVAVQFPLYEELKVSFGEPFAIMLISLCLIAAVFRIPALPMVEFD